MFIYYFYFYVLLFLVWGVVGRMSPTRDLWLEYLTLPPSVFLLHFDLSLEFPNVPLAVEPSFPRPV